MSNMKKGYSSWMPASVTDVVDKVKGYRYRWIEKTPANKAKKQAEGWEIVSGLSSDQVSPAEPERVLSGKNLTSTYEKHDVVLARMPEEMAQERDAYFNAESARRVQGLSAHLKKDMQDKGGNAPVHGDITISSRKGQQVID
jgi:hypothetical protein